jgi:hypothetical protein
VNALRRKGALAPGAFGTLTWEREGDVQTSVDFRADSAGIVLSYGDHNGEAPRAVEQHVALSRSVARAPTFCAPARDAASGTRYSTFLPEALSLPALRRSGLRK